MKWSSGIYNLFSVGLWKGRRKDKDVQPVTSQEDSKRYLEEECREKMIDTDWERLVSLPQGVDKTEWLATHTLSFFDHINMIYGSVSEFCTSTGCSSMNAPGNVQYLWVDEKGKKSKCVAPQYIELVMTFTKKTIHDENVFPTKYGNVFPQSFDTFVKKIHRLLFHVIAHLYQAHYKEIEVLRLHPHLNTVFEHFVTFVRLFSLVEEKEIEILDDLYKKLRAGASLQKESMGAPLDLPPPPPGEGSVMEQDYKYSTYCDEGERLTGSDINSPAVRPTSLPCGSDQEHKHHHSANGNPSCISRHDDNKENVICDSNQSDPALSPRAMMPMST